jgi:hypothetical protein
MSATKKMWLRRLAALDPVLLKDIVFFFPKLILKTIALAIYAVFEYFPIFFIVAMIALALWANSIDNANDELRKTVATVDYIAKVRSDPAITACMDEKLAEHLAKDDAGAVTMFFMKNAEDKCRELASRNIVGNVKTTSKQQAEDIKKLLGSKP